MNHRLRRRFEAAQAHKEIAGAVHDDDERARGDFEPTERPGHPQGHAIGRLQSDRFWKKLSEDDVHEGDHHEGERAGDRMAGQPRPGFGQCSEDSQKGIRQRDLSDPAQANAAERDPKLRGGNRAIQMIGGVQRRARPFDALGKQFLQARFADRNQAELGCDKKSIRPDEDRNAQQAQQG